MQKKEINNHRVNVSENFGAPVVTSLNPMSSFDLIEENMELSHIHNTLLRKKNLNFFFQHSCILEYCVEQLENKDPPVHNYLLSLYIKHQPEAVWPYFQRFKG
jgi:hypothetical protein